MHSPQTTQQTPGWKLFNYYWHCRVPYVYTLDPIETAIRGLPTSGSKQQDEASLREMTLMHLPIVRDEEEHPQIVSLVELFEQNVDIQFVNATDPAKIYDMVVDHLQDTAEKFNSSLFFLSSVIEADESKKRLVEDILLLEKFANSLYPMAQKFREKPKVAPTTFMQTLNYWRMGKPLMGETPIEPIDEEAPNPFTSLLNKQSVQRLKPWQ